MTERETWYRDFYPGMGRAVAERTILRKHADGSWETWGDVATRVALGNSLLCQDKREQRREFETLRKHIGNMTLLMSGRHLQHGDQDQPTRNMELHVNCATSASSFCLFMLLLNGSGVGRSYDDDMILVNWDNAPTIRCVLDHEHPDFDWSAHESVRDARHKYGNGRDVMWFEVPDSREGWAKALELWENAAFEKIHKDKMLILDFSNIRAKGSPIKGMQNRPASGPVPLMNAFLKAGTLKGSGLHPWKQAMYVDHYFAECVLVGGSRRSARMSTKTWRDKNVIDFVRVKRPVEYADMSMEEIIEYRKSHQPLGFLWSSNNSVTVDAEFWRLVQIKRGEDEFNSEWAKHARNVFRTVSEAAYGDGTGEPGFINVDRLEQRDDGWDDLTRDGTYVGSKKYQINEDTELYLKRLAKRAKRMKYRMITNPCVTADTWIATAEGPKQVSELINVPFTAIVEDQPYTATGFWCTGEKETIRLTFSNGNDLALTADHKILTQNGLWIAAGQLSVGSIVLCGDSSETAIESIEPAGPKFVYDCSVDGLHAFTANGIIVHNCGEVNLSVLSGFCVIADVVPFHAEDLDEAEDAFRAAVRAMIRVNQMDSIYNREVRRTNRIGISVTGIHEFAWKFFQVGFRDLIDPDFEQSDSWLKKGDWINLAAPPRVRAAHFWRTMSRFNRAVREESIRYAEQMGVVVPHTSICVKPAGSTSKLAGLTEGWHLPSKPWYLRWVQFRHDDPLVQKYAAVGYPTRELKSYQGTIIVGFPTQPMIGTFNMGDALVTATAATPEEHYKWLMLGERYWIDGTDERGEPVREQYGSQISYTLLYDPAKTSYKEFRDLMLNYQSRIKCCSVMPITDTSAYEYSPEQVVTKAEFEAFAHAIKRTLVEDVGREHVGCDSGACPVDFVEEKPTE